MTDILYDDEELQALRDEFEDVCRNHSIIPRDLSGVVAPLQDDEGAVLDEDDDWFTPLSSYYD